MIYRVNRDAHGDNFTDLNTEADAIALSNQLGFGYAPYTPPSIWSREVFLSQLAIAFDAKFETYWRGKGYESMEDLLSHAANPYSQYHLEALSLINWWHTEWNDAVQNITEESNIEEIINNLDPYNG